MATWLGVIGVGIMAVSSVSAHTPYSAEEWAMERGLPHDIVTAVLQTRDKYLWVGTRGGLARFDGMRFTTFRVETSPELTNQSIKALVEDAHGTLWIGTEKGLVSYAHNRFELRGFADDAVTALCNDAAGDLWVGTAEAGLFRLHGGTVEAFAADPAMPGKSVRSIFSDTAGRVWVGYEGFKGIVCFERGKFRRLATADEVSGEVLSIAECPENVLWFGTNNGLFRFAGGIFSRCETGPENKKILSLYVDASRTLWVASTWLSKIVGGDPSSLEPIDVLGVKSFHGLCRDDEGNLWVGTSGEGLLRVREPAFQALALDAKNTATGIRTVTQDSHGTIWMAHGALGLTRIDPDWKITPLRPQGNRKNSDVLAVLAARDGALWVGMRDALQIWRGENVDTLTDQPGARAMFQARDGTIWLGRQEAGIVLAKEGVLSPLPMPAEVQTCTAASFAETSTGEMYIGTWSHGLLRVTRGEVTRVDHNVNLPLDEMRFVFVDHEDNIWLGTRNHGLGLVVKGKIVTPEWTSELIDRQVEAITEDGAGNLWLETTRGILVVARADLLDAMKGQRLWNSLRIVDATEGTRHGISDLACFPNVWRTNDGQIWFATRKAALLVDTRKALQVRPPPPVHIERILANGQRMDLDEPLDLRPGTRELTIEYTALSFSAPGRVRFQYRLDGFDKDWINAEDRRYAHYTNLPAGKYRFRVTAAYGDYPWNTTEARLDFVQQAHLYETPWILSVAAITVIGLGVGLYRWRVSALRRKNAWLEKRIAERTCQLRVAKEQAEASTQAKTEFLENISHEIRNPLNGIIGLVSMLRESPLGGPERDLAHSLGACAKSLARVFDEVLNYSRLEHGQVTLNERPFSLRELLEEVAALYRVTARQRGTEIVVHAIDDAIDRCVGDDEKIKSIIGNFVNNALKYAPGAPVELMVQVDAMDDYGADVTINVIDHGAGIPADEQELIFKKFVRGAEAKRQRAPGAGLGLATCRTLADLMGGHVAVESELGAGATFFLMVRLKRERNGAARTSEDMGAVAGPARRALIVEDQAYNQVVVRRLAERLGYATDVADDGSVALAKMAERPYALVLLDWELPGMKGDEVVRRIRAEPWGKNVIVIATTAHDGDDIRQLGLEAGMDGFALKPFGFEALSRLIDEVRARRGDSGPGVPLDTRVFSFVGQDDPRQTEQAAALYAQILEKELALLNAAVSEADIETAVQVAHRLKSHAGLVDASALRAAADRFQREAGVVSAEDVAALHREIARHAGVLRSRLRSWREVGAAG